MLWKPLGDHLALEQLLISAHLHPAGFSASVALGAFGFGVSVTSIFFFFLIFKSGSLLIIGEITLGQSFLKEERMEIN